MNIKQLAEENIFTLLNMGENEQQEIKKPFCCDLLSICMSRMPRDAAWVTVMGNINTLAVLSLTDAACIVLAENAVFDEPALEKAKQEKITVFRTELPVFEAALAIEKKLHDFTDL
ncbi:MAG: hypothetical protein PWP24_897 [Clostridiales bacterium]|nr:hypothetical protein [Clostridiales bacterium]